MSLRIVLPTAIAIVVIAGSANAQNNHIQSWGEGTAGTDFTISDALRTIVILRGDSHNYKFYAEDSMDAQNLGVINNISINPAAAGDFTLLIRHQNGGLGARHG